MTTTLESLISAVAAALEGEPGHTLKAWSKGDHQRIYVTRYGRQNRGYISYRSDDDGEIDAECIDTSQLDIAGVSDYSMHQAIMSRI